MRTSFARPSTRAAALAAATLLALGLAGCGTESPDSGSGQAQEGAESPALGPDEMARYDGQVCPEGLQEGDGAAEPAETAPTLPSAESGWVCEYRPGSGGGEDGPPWERAGEARELAPAELAEVTESLEGLEPAEKDRMCTMDIGPRWMLVLVDDGDLTGVVMDDFGCHDVRLTDDPHATVPGSPKVAETEGLVAGNLTAPAGLLEAVQTGQSGQGAQPGDGPDQGPDDGKMWAAMMERLDCPQTGAAVFMHDMTEPDPGVTIRQALEPWQREGGEIVVDAREGDRAAGSVVVEGRTVIVLQLVRWDTGGWAVEGGAEC